MTAIIDTLKNINWLMVLSLTILLSISIVYVGSAALNMPVEGSGKQQISFKSYILKQCIWIVIGLGAFFITLRFNYRTFYDYAYTLYAAGIVILLILFLFPVVQNTHSWIKLKFISFQPSEFMKIFYVFAMARFLSNWDKRDRITDLTVPVLITGIPLVIIMLQPDLGTAMVFVPVMFVLIYMAGVKVRYLAGTILLFLIAALLILVVSDLTQKEFGRGLISDYQKKRVTAFLNPEKEKLGVSYQSYQSLAAIGSGRAFGRGLAKGIQTQFDQLPAKHTDFIISVVAEEGGFVVILLVLLCFYVFLISAFLTAHNAPDSFGRLVVIGIIGIISAQILINIGVAVSLLPITGITLPFISYGGSSMVTSFIAIGVVMSVGREKKAYFA